MNRFPWRILLYTIFLGYLLLDLKACHGPLYRSLASRGDDVKVAAAKHDWVALVNQEPITAAQLDLATARHLFQRGKSPEEIPEKNLAIIRRAALQGLIDDTLVRQYADGEEFSAPASESDEFVASWISQFGSGEILKGRAALQDLEEIEYREELARIWSRKSWLERRVAPGVDVTDEEVRDWFEANRDSGEGFREPEKVRARHLFLSTVETDDETREMKIREMHRQLVEGEKEFEELAREISEDPATNKAGGNLGWFARGRLPNDFTDSVFALEVGEISAPFKTSIGWHIAEVTDRQQARDATFEEVAPEIRVHLANQRTAETVKRLLEKLRTVANIRIFAENL